jgi:hypothetical protein
MGAIAPPACLELAFSKTILQKIAVDTSLPVRPAPYQDAPLA